MSAVIASHHRHHTMRSVLALRLCASRFPRASTNARHLTLRRPFSISSPALSEVTFKDKVKAGPSLSEFIHGGTSETQTTEDHVDDPIPYLKEFNPATVGQGRSVYVETYGCQMNVSDTEIIKSIMITSGFGEAESAEQVRNMTGNDHSNFHQADVVFLNTCAVRERAEDKIWDRLDHLNGLRRHGHTKKDMIIGVLGDIITPSSHRPISSPPSSHIEPVHAHVLMFSIRLHGRETQNEDHRESEESRHCRRARRLP